VLRWHNRVMAYAVLLVTDRYPPFSLGEHRDTEPQPHLVAPV
jgi:hypothetical protein